jgi:Polyketide cyclase / dehydrase and lipid transport
MPLLSGSCSGEVPFAVERCWALIADVEHAPEWQRTLESVEVLERDGRGRPSICDTVSNAKLFKVRCRVRMSYEDLRTVRWAQVASDDLDAMEGAWEIEALGPSLTRATYRLAVDPGPIGLLARPLERAIRPIAIGHQVGELARALESGR